MAINHQVSALAARPIDYIAGLDGLRTLAVLVVMSFHARVPGISGGFLGVDLFFVLSGYLITRILVAEIARTGTLNLRRFYLRRLARLYPALLLMLTVTIALWPWAFPDRPNAWLEVTIAALYFSDISIPLIQLPRILGHTWSLSIEEHFYLLWPLVLLGLLRLKPRTQLQALIGLFMATTLWRWHSIWVGDPWTMTYPRFDLRLSGLVLGSLLAIWQPRLPRWSGAAGFIALLWAITASSWEESGSLMHWMLLAEVGAGAVILSANQWPLLTLPPLVWLGRLSYGLYLWHYPIMRWCRANALDWQTTLVIGAGLSLMAAALSYYTIEALARRWSHRVSPSQIPSPLT